MTVRFAVSSGLADEKAAVVPIGLICAVRQVAYCQCTNRDRDFFGRAPTFDGIQAVVHHNGVTILGWAVVSVSTKLG